MIGCSLFFREEAFNSVPDEVVPSTMSKDRDLGFRKGDARRFRERDGTRCTQVHVPAVEDCYIVLAIQYMNICVQGVAVDGLYLV
jgi:hypothetical protein